MPSANQAATPRTPRKPKARASRRDAGRPRGEPIAEAVLDRTLEELASVGPAQLSVERIARAAEVNKTSIYRRWPTREALVAAALERVFTHLSLGQRTPARSTVTCCSSARAWLRSSSSRPGKR